MTLATRSWEMFALTNICLEEKQTEPDFLEHTTLYVPPCQSMTLKQLKIYA